MVLIIDKGYKPKYAYGGRGLFDTVGNLFERVFSSSAARELGSKAVNAATQGAIKVMEQGANTIINKVVHKMTKPKRNDLSSKSKERI